MKTTATVSAGFGAWAPRQRCEIEGTLSNCIGVGLFCHGSNFTGIGGHLRPERIDPRLGGHARPQEIKVCLPRLKFDAHRDTLNDLGEVARCVVCRD